ncbi:MAG: dipeptide epimerase [Rhodospirillales bacterium]|nr:dipeptide epimerase [Rhodospirillales bacterium]
MQLSVTRECWPLRRSFAIARGSRTEARVLTVTLEDAGIVGHGEALPYARYGESPEASQADLEALLPAAQAGFDRVAAQGLLPPGAARNALDCALWDLEAKRTGKRAWQLAGLDPLQTVTTAYTLSLDSPAKMAAAAAENAWRPLLKLKLAGPEDLARVAAVRSAAPESRLIVDANEGWDIDTYRTLAPQIAAMGVALVEQPLPAQADEALRGEARPLPLCADESCHDRTGLDRLVGLYDCVNIKLDKTGGLTEALALKAAAKAAGLAIMVGCMVATSLAMAPAVLLAQGAAFVDLDGPLLLAQDRVPGLTFEGSKILPPPAALWG